MKKRRFASIRFFAMAAVVFCLSLFTLLFITDGIGYAVLPQSYQTEVKDEHLDWHTAQRYLNIEQLKRTVKCLIEDDYYDFSKIESDPVVVAVIDSGINPEHELFAGCYDDDGNRVAGSKQYDVLLRNGSGGLIAANTVIKSGYVSSSVIDDAPDMHGTHVAGIVASLIHELDLEKYIKIMPIKAAYPSPEGKGSEFDKAAIVSALSFAMSNGADVVNMSFTSSDTDFSGLISYEMSRKAVFVAAAGNNGTSGNRYPAADGNVIGVMNYYFDALGKPELWSNSNYGTQYDICAPGTKIFSADGASNDSYKGLTGTSMASPIVSFGAALAMLKYRAIANNGNTKTPQDIAELVRNSYTSTILHRNRQLKVFDINKLIQPDDGIEVRIRISDGSLNQTLGSVGKIDFTCEVLPSVTGGSVEWYEYKDGNANELGSQKSLSYTPDNLVGATDICVIWTDDTDSTRTITAFVTVRVDYAEADTKHIKISADTSRAIANFKYFKVGSSVVFGLSDADNVNPELPVLWYINGSYECSGRRCEFVADKEGTYTVRAKVDGQWLDDAYVIKIDNKDYKTAYAAAIASATVAGVIVATAVTLTVIIILKRKRARKAQ